jgi:hypothetical protein
MVDTRFAGTTNRLQEVARAHRRGPASAEDILRGLIRRLARACGRTAKIAAQIDALLRSLDRTRPAYANDAQSIAAICLALLHRLRRGLRRLEAVEYLARRRRPARRRGQRMHNLSSAATAVGCKRIRRCRWDTRRVKPTRGNKRSIANRRRRAPQATAGLPVSPSALCRWCAAQPFGVPVGG